MNLKLHIGMRKVKSLISLSLAFLLWQALRVFLPLLEAHPLFAYIYAVIEMRDTPEKTKDFAKLRIKATFVGLFVGLVFIFLSFFFVNGIQNEAIKVLAEFIFILLATLVSICLAEITNCKTFCGIAAIITIISMVSHDEKDIYFYAIMRVVQTLIGVFCAMLVNMFFNKKSDENK